MAYLRFMLPLTHHLESVPPKSDLLNPMGHQSLSKKPFLAPHGDFRGPFFTSAVGYGREETYWSLNSTASIFIAGLGHAGGGGTLSLEGH